MIIRFAMYGCRNRPFFHIVVIPQRRTRQGKIIEQIGTYDPLVNRLNEKLVSVNFNRLSYYLAAGAHMTKSVAQLFGLSGFLPLHPMSIINAERNSKKAAAAAKEDEGSSVYLVVWNKAREAVWGLAKQILNKLAYVPLTNCNSSRLVPSSSFNTPVLSLISLIHFYEPLHKPVVGKLIA
ncbi:RP-S16 [Acanthosepion pharaonis]|uniref:Small ribosomal subunit protein bS16m n=1 Tax=Acanthosepion pharaonis TaxID=158019 RepID=A0A812DCW9_ACAPH|nr:RP-S16 [Sepia pharaonis]